MIMRDGNFSTIIQQQEEDEAQKLMEKEQRAMTSTSAGKALLLVQSVLSLHNVIQSSIPQKLGSPSKVKTLEMDSIFLLLGCLLHPQAVFRVAEKNPLWT